MFSAVEKPQKIEILLPSLLQLATCQVHENAAPRHLLWRQKAASDIVFPYSRSLGPPGFRFRQKAGAGKERSVSHLSRGPLVYLGATNTG